MHRWGSALALTLAVVAPAAAAEPRISFDGTIGVAAEDGDRPFGLYSNVSASWRLSDRLSLDFGDFGRFSASYTPHETYGAVGWHFAAGTLSAGMPRPAYDRYALSQLDWMLPLQAADETQVAIARSRLTWGAMFDDYLPWGVAWQSQGGAADWAVSLHRVPSLGLTIGSAGIAWSDEDWALSAAVEASSDGEGGGKIAAERRLGTVTAEVGRFISPRLDGLGFMEGAMRWKATERLQVGMLMQIPTGDGHRRLGAIAARYEVVRGELGVGVMVEHGEAEASLAMGWKF